MNSHESLLRRQVKKELEAYIYSHDPGEKLPSEPLLAKQLGVSRTTVRAVLETLAASGIVQKRHGSGTYINPKPFLFQESLLRYIRYPALIELKGYTATEHERKIFRAGADPQVSEQLNLQEGEECVIVQTIYCADEHLAVFCRDTLPLGLIPPERWNHFFTALRRRDLRDLIFEETGRRTEQSVVELHAVLSSKVEAMAPYLTSTEICPMVRMCGCCFDHNRQALFYNEAYLDTRYLDLRLNR